MHTLYAWYKQRRADGIPAKDALWSARAHVKAEAEAEATLAALSPASRARIENFVHDFIRGPEVEALTCDRDADFINEPERAARCHDAAEDGCDGKTHHEVIEDWRDAFSNWLSDEHKSYWQGRELFANAVRARFTSTELWHAFAGSLFQEIG